MNDLGQQSSTWNDSWKETNPLSEIRMWDYYGGRQWISKYVPRYGKVIEAGCGLGRYVFYLKKLGVDIEGIDFSEKAIEKLNATKTDIDPSVKFVQGDVTALPYEDNSLSGYISLGVVEHFIEGPQKAIAEAYRVLRPGGIAIITTPNKSFYVRYLKSKSKVKKLIKKIIGRKIVNPPFFQYEYTPNQLKYFCEKQGFYVSRAEGCDLLYPFNEIGRFKGENLNSGSFAYWFAHKFENSWLKYFGGQSVTISIKLPPPDSNKMYCFLSGKLNATADSLAKFDVPVSSEMQNSETAACYLKNRKVAYARKYSINPPVAKPETRVCEFSGKQYATDPLFEDFGFNVKVAPDRLLDPIINMLLCTHNIAPVWRKRRV
jgi:ubiquinone/menaquinone biosynthesis C-methylase UbiE